MTATTKTPQEIVAEEKVDREEGFSIWMDQPATRMMTSMIPYSGEHYEVLQTLLQEAYSSGYNRGMGRIVGSLLQAILLKEGK